MLHGVIVHHCHIVYVWHREGDDVVVVGIVNVDTSDLNLTGIQEELAGLWKTKKKDFNLVKSRFLTSASTQIMM